MMDGFSVLNSPVGRVYTYRIRKLRAREWRWLDLTVEFSKLSTSLQNRNAFATRLMVCKCLTCNVLVVLGSGA
jgi:hypothetical protein